MMKMNRSKIRLLFVLISHLEIKSIGLLYWQTQIQSSLLLSLQRSTIWMRSCRRSSLNNLQTIFEVTFEFSLNGCIVIHCKYN